MHSPVGKVRRLNPHRYIQDTNRSKVIINTNGSTKIYSSSWHRHACRSNRRQSSSFCRTRKMAIDYQAHQMLPNACNLTDQWNRGHIIAEIRVYTTIQPMRICVMSRVRCVSSMVDDAKEVHGRAARKLQLLLSGHWHTPFTRHALQLHN